MEHVEQILEPKMLTFEDALAMGMTPFIDDRHKCVECSFYNKSNWKGKCHKDMVQFPKVAIRCWGFQSVLKVKEVFTDNRFWE
jgi:hypothetical protein